MTDTTTPITVRFVKPKGWAVMAVFMRASAERHYNSYTKHWLRTCYQHLGQHGTCTDNFTRAKRATVEQYSELLEELESLGYSVTITQ